MPTGAGIIAGRKGKAVKKLAQVTGFEIYRFTEPNKKKKDKKKGKKKLVKKKEWYDLL